MDRTGRVLIIEDDRRLADGWRLALTREGHTVDVAHTAEEGLTLAARESPDLIVLDLGLPDQDGLQVTQRLRQRSFVPIMICTGAATDEQDKVVGLRFGADDYLVKPFGLPEFCARVAALLRRSAVYSQGTGGQLKVAGLLIDLEAYEVRRDGQRIELTPKEYDLLVALAEAPHRVRTRDWLLERVWGYSREVRTRTLDMHIRRLREKLEVDPAEPKLIQTVIGVGYKLVG